jgi:cytochrome c oxidase cbb3-type subunit III
MRLSFLASIVCAALVLMCAGCSTDLGPGRVAESVRPQDELNFPRLFAQNCSACHGQDGKDGPALDLANPEYQALVDDVSLKRWITSGIPGTQMPAFGESAGGMLTDQQIDALVSGIRRTWAAGTLKLPSDAPSYVATLEGDSKRGEQVYKAECLSCHREEHQRITDSAYLALVTDQELRTIVIAGRPDLGQPDWKTTRSGHSLTYGEVTDVVAYLGTFRSGTPGQPYPDQRSGGR